MTGDARDIRRAALQRAEREMAAAQTTTDKHYARLALAKAKRNLAAMEPEGQEGSETDATRR